MNVKIDTTKLVDAKGLLDALFDRTCRPTTRWLLEQRKTGRIPYTKCGRLIFYDCNKVHEALFPK
jgi:hypothetical protein